MQTQTSVVWSALSRVPVSQHGIFRGGKISLIKPNTYFSALSLLWEKYQLSTNKYVLD